MLVKSLLNVLYFSFLMVQNLFQVLGETLHITSEYMSQEVRASSAEAKAKVLSDDLRAKRQIILEKDEQLQAMKERVKTVAAKSVEAFQQTEEYNTVLFN